jgi:hypothetical protein
MVCPRSSVHLIHVSTVVSLLYVKRSRVDDIVDHCCYAWNTLIDQPWKIMSVARRDWATVGYSM